MIIFWLYAAPLFATALLFILLPQLYFSRGSADARRALLNVGLYRERLHELEMQHELRPLDAVQLEAARIEAARELLGDMQELEQVSDTPLGRSFPLLAAVCMPVLALILYLRLGSLDELVQARRLPGPSAQSIEKLVPRSATSLAAGSAPAEG